MISRIKRHPWRAAAVGAVAMGVVAAGCLAIPAQADPSDNTATTTPIKHVVVIFSENVSFDHYFATYPNAANTDGTHFTASPSTPTDINTLAHPTDAADAGRNLLTANPNTYQPQRLTHDEAWTTSQNHNYTPEEKAEDGGAMDKFYENTTTGTSPAQVAAGQTSPTGIVMDYYDGNTVTGLWNYAQNYSMSDNSWDAQFGPSTVGAVNLVSGQTGGAVIYNPGDTTNPLADPAGSASGVSAVSNGVGTIIGDPEPAYDDCANNDHTRAGNPDVAGMASTDKNVGDLLNAKGVTWGWFQGGFTPTTPWDGTAGDYAKCDSQSLHYGSNSSLVVDYSPHHNPFEYYKSTSNPHHLPPTSVAAVGTTDQANHQYDLSYFNDALAAGNLPAVSFLKAPAAEDGHPSNSTPLDEQKFMTTEINSLEQSPEWSSTAVVIAYDDSDGWYDHVAPIIKNASNTSDDDAICKNAANNGVNIIDNIADRCGPSQRIPLLVISPYAKKNYVDHTEVDQTSILKFIEDNWSLGQIGGGSLDTTAGSINGMLDFANPQTNTVLLSPTTGAVLANGATTVPSITTKTTVKTSKTSQVYDTATPAKLTATVSGGTGTVSGSVGFYAAGKLLALKSLSAGKASYTLPKTESVATHSFTAKFTSSNTALASNSASSAVKVKVVKATATTGIKYSKGKIAVTVKANTKVTVKANTKVTVNGKAKVYDGKKVIKTVTITKGKGGFKVKLKKGTHKLHAVFATTKTIASDASKTISVKIK